MPCSHGKQYPAHCRSCRPVPLCPHGKRQIRCADCGGASICEHKRIRYGCKECKGTGICPHSLVKSECRTCRGSRFCTHGKRKAACADCGGSSLCEHGVKRYSCKPCGGNGICSHGTYKVKCRECGGSQICPHNKVRYQCRDCGGSGYCEHNKLRNYCKECGGSAYCTHGKLRRICKDCGGSQICEHNKNRNYCKPCGGSACCKSEWCDTIPSNPRYGGYCLVCYIHLFPDQPITRNYKTKERAVADLLRSAFPDKTWVHDRRVADGCSQRRPDLLCDMGAYVVVVEIDEDQHAAYDTTCENRRLMEISRDLGHRPLVFIRFNPDSYHTAAGEIVESCWRLNELGTCSLTDPTEWAARTVHLVDTVRHYLNTPTDKTLTVASLYFSA